MPEPMPARLGVPRREVAAWKMKRNERGTNIDWQFTTDDARTKLKSLHPTL